MFINKKLLAAGLGMLGIVAVVAGTSTASAAQPKREFTPAQHEAIQEARDLRAEGDIEGARKVLEDANVFRAAHKERRVLTEEQKAKMEGVRTAVTNGDYAAFQAAAGEKLKEKISNESDFSQLVDARELKEEGKVAEARAILKELGFKIHSFFKNTFRFN